MYIFIFIGSWDKGQSYLALHHQSQGRSVLASIANSNVNKCGFKNDKKISSDDMLPPVSFEYEFDVTRSDILPL